MHLAHEIDDHTEDDKQGYPVDEDARDQAAIVLGLDRELHALFVENLVQRAVGRHDRGIELLPILQFGVDALQVVVQHDFADVAVVHLGHEIRIRHGIGFGTAAKLEALHDGDQDHRDNNPEQKIFEHSVH